MSNSLAAEKSPYLRQHADNPVAWLPWGEAAFAQARAEQKPIFLSIGYSTCHWCHVMAHECFENADAFHAHQVRVGESEWGRKTQNIERKYTITGLRSS